MLASKIEPETWVRAKRETAAVYCRVTPKTRIWVTGKAEEGEFGWRFPGVTEDGREGLFMPADIEAVPDESDESAS